MEDFRSVSRGGGNVVLWTGVRVGVLQGLGCCGLERCGRNGGLEVALLTLKGAWSDRGSGFCRGWSRAWGTRERGPLGAEVFHGVGVLRDGSATDAMEIQAMDPPWFEVNTIKREEGVTRGRGLLGSRGEMGTGVSRMSGSCGGLAVRPRPKRNSDQSSGSLIIQGSMGSPGCRRL